MGAIPPPRGSFTMLDECFYYVLNFEDWWPGAGTFVFSFHLSFLYLSTDQALVWRRMGLDEVDKEGRTFGGFWSVRIVGFIVSLADCVGVGFFL